MTEALLQHVFWHYGFPKEIKSDHVLQFVAWVWKSFFKKLGATVNLISEYHPESNGQVECSIKEPSQFLWSYCNDWKHDWTEFLVCSECTQNSLCHSATSLTPLSVSLAINRLSVLGMPHPLTSLKFTLVGRVWEGAHTKIH